MADTIYGLADFGNPAGDAGGSFVVHYHHSFDRLLCVFFEFLFHVGGLRSTPPVPWNVIHLQAMSQGNIAPEIGEMPGLKHQYAVARRKRIHNRRLPSA